MTSPQPPKSSTPLWVPTESEIQSSELMRFVKQLKMRTDIDLKSYAQLHKWSVEHLEDFWAACAEFFELPFTTPPEQTLIRGKHMTESQWFVGGRLNYAEALLQTRGKDPAIISIEENGHAETLSFDELAEAVRALHVYFRTLGIRQGDVIAAYMPHTAATIVGFLAGASLGAIWTSCSTDFGSDAVTDRFQQTQPRLLLTVNATRYKGKIFPMEEKVEAVLKDIPSIQHVVELAFVKANANEIKAKPKANEIEVPPLRDKIFPQVSTSVQTWVDYHQIISQIQGQDKTAAMEIEFAALPFDHPLYILYSSGTTGRPKCIVHRAGGALLKHLSELSLHLNLKQGERLLFFTTCGWMMWNWQVSALARSVTLVLYEGAPLMGRPTALLEEVAKHRVNVFGAGAAYYNQLKVHHVTEASLQAQLTPQSADLGSLRTLLSTGSPLSDDLFYYLSETLGQGEAGDPAKDSTHNAQPPTPMPAATPTPTSTSTSIPTPTSTPAPTSTPTSTHKRIQIASISGGTDIVACFVLGCPILPVYSGEIQCRALGVAVDIFNEEHRAVRQEKGELVCTQPFPSMPLYFYGDDAAKSRYKEAYFHTLENVWFQGDFAEITEHDGLIIHGRSDNTLNPGGVRIGTAEIYKHLETIDAIVEAAAVTYDRKESIQLILFIVLRKDRLLSEDLKTQIKTVLRTQASPRHVPQTILSVPDLPRTVNGKIAEKAIKHAIHKHPIKNVSTLANPDVLQQFTNLADHL